MRGLKSVFEGFPMKSLEDEDVDLIKEAAREIRAWAVTMTSAANSGHPAGSLSSMEMYLMVYGAADITPENFMGLERDFVVVSHGHTSPGAYAVLARYGFISSESAMAHFRQVGSPFQGHVERVVPGIDWGSGNLGQGLSAGVGFALAIRARNRQDHVYVLMSDGEQVKGQVAEARRIASHHRLAGITALVDCNDIQISGRTRDIMKSDIPSLWRIDGWSVIECDGHDPRALYKALADARAGDRPMVILCHTMMGKGVSFMEGVPDYHGKAASGNLYVQAMKELGASPALLDEALKGRTAGVLDPPSRPTSTAPSIVIGDPRSYGPDDRTDNRSGFGKALEDVGRLNYKSPGSDPVLVFDCDLAGSVKVDGFAKACPEWFIEAGVQEHSTATVAGAASICGVTSLWADFGVFGLGEAYNQQRLNDINRTNLKLALTHVGLDVGEDGETHQCIDYIGLLKNLFGWRLLVPADPNQADRMTRWALSNPGNICIAMGRSKIPVVTDEEGNPFFAGDYVFRYGAVDLLRKGRDAAIIAMGHMAGGALRAREILKDQGFDVAVYHAGCPLQLDASSIVEAARTGRIVTFEDHHASTGLGSTVASVLLETGDCCPLRTLGVTRYGDSGASSEVLSAMGLDPENLAAAVRNLIVR